MICYRDRTYCSDDYCGNMECTRNIQTIDREHFDEVGLPLAIADFSKNCEIRKERKNDTD